MALPDIERNNVSPENSEQPVTRIYTLGYSPEFKNKLREAGVFKNLSPFELLSTLTEEEIGVVLAKISRNPGGFIEIAQGVTEEGAAKFLQKWVASVEGYGHASVAEHAVIHLAVENVSSLAADELTGNRLSSWTEFSARFKGHQNVGYYIPDSVKANPELDDRWKKVHVKLFGLNNDLSQKGLKYIQSEEGRKKHPERRADGSKGTKTVSDQFKNIMPGSRLTSLGGTINARSAEHAVRKALSHPQSEIRSIGQQVKDACIRIAPTLIKYANKNPYLITTREKIEQSQKTPTDKKNYPTKTKESQPVVLIEHDKNAEAKFIAAARYQKSSGETFEQVFAWAQALTIEEKNAELEILLGDLGTHDAPIRILEAAGDYFIEVGEMTYGDLREWRRHRMELYGAKEPNVDCGYMVPPLAEEMDQSENPEFHGSVVAINEVMEEVDELFYDVQKVDPEAAKYLVTRLHYVPTIIKMNLREAFHFVSLRTGPTAHPFIRNLAWAFFDEIQKVHPSFAAHLEKRLKAKDRPDRNFQWTY